MNSGRASESGFDCSYLHGGGDPCMGGRDLSWEDVAEREDSVFSTSQWGGVSVVQPSAVEHHPLLYPSGYDPSALFSTPLFSALPGNDAWTVMPHTNVRQVPVSAGVLSPEPPQRSARKRRGEVEQAVALPASKKTAGRTVQIADFTWTLPADPGEGGPYPSLIFLIGAAISSCESKRMEAWEIRQWIREHYPSRPISADSSIATLLTKTKDFVSTRAGKKVGKWKLCDPLQFGSYYEKDIFRRYRYRCGVMLNMALWSAQSSSKKRRSASAETSLSGQILSPGTGGDTHLAPALPVKIGGHILTLSPYSAGQKRPSLRLLCGCAIALGSEQGSGLREVVKWVADRYSVREANALRKLYKNTRKTLALFRNDFQCTNICAPRSSIKGRVGMRWVLKNPADFAVRYGGVVCSQDSSRAGGTGTRNKKSLFSESS